MRADAVAVSELPDAALHRRLAEAGPVTSGGPSLPGRLSHKRPNSLNGGTSTNSVLIINSASARTAELPHMSGKAVLVDLRFQTHAGPGAHDLTASAVTSGTLLHRRVVPAMSSSGMTMA